MKRATIVMVCALLGALSLVQAVGYAWMLAPVAQGSTTDRFGRPAAWDFRAFYGAAHFAHEGEPEAVYDDARLLAYSRELFGQTTYPIPWPYPPSTLLLVAPLGRLSYSAALAVWLALGIASMWIAARLVAPRRDLPWLLILSPAFTYALAVGQISPLIAALLLVGLSLLRERPVVAGMCLGALVLKPHFALLLPFLLFARPRRVTLLCAAGVSLGLIGVSFAIFGSAPWQTYLSVVLRHGSDLLSQPRPNLWLRVPITYVLLRELGVTSVFAWFGHVIVGALACLALVRGVRSGQLSLGRRALLFCSATLLALPHVWDYDLVILLVPAALIWREHDGQPPLWMGLVLFGLVSIGAWLRYLTGAIGLQVGPLLWVALLLWACSPRAWHSSSQTHAITASAS